MPLSNGFASFRRIVLSAACAGVLTGLLMTALETTIVVPLILQAEQYEQKGRSNAGLEPDHASHGHDTAHEHEAEPPEGVQRTLYTAMATLLMAVAYGLLLGACFAQMQTAGWRKGIVLGFAGFLVFQLAPALGLPPVPPGAPSADLGPRQIWWVGTVLATGSGLAFLYFASQKKARYGWIVGVVLLALPHLIGAPQAEVGPGPVPQELARDFAIASVLAAALFWLLLGGVQGYIFERLARRF